MKHPDPIAPLLADTRAHVQAQLESGGRVRDFAAMITRARAIDPSAVSEAALSEVADYAPVVVLRRPAPPPTPAAPPRSRRGLWIGAAIAAALLLTLIGPARYAFRDEATPTGNAVQHLGPAPATDAVQVPRPVPARRVAPIVEPEPEPDPEPGPVIEVVPAPIVAPIERARHSPRAAPTESAAELDRRAREAWRTNDLAEARRLFTRLVDTASDPRLVELAYGDIFVLARQLGDHRGLERARRAYLDRFGATTGVYADDARAGLCRGASDGAECWRRYLAAHPTGAHVDEARRAIDLDIVARESP